MSPEEHKLEAERLLASVHAIAENYPEVDAVAQAQAMRELVAIAQVHATLATFKPEKRYVVSNDNVRFDAGVITKETP